MTIKVTPGMTLLDAVVLALRSLAAPVDGLARPAAILFADPDRRWAPLTDLLLENVPELCVFGTHEPSRRTGPAIWLRCVIEGAVEVPARAAERVPILYLPGVRRSDLRAGEECPGTLKPLVELLYRGVEWVQRGGHEWTVSAFMTSSATLGLDVAKDAETHKALGQALCELARTPLARFQGRRLEAEDFDRLLTTDIVRDLLRWMNDPADTRRRMSAEAWSSFKRQVGSAYALNPEDDGVTVAGVRLGMAEGAWRAVWERYAESPREHPALPELLRRARPADLFVERSHWPDDNDEDEGDLRGALLDLEGVSHHEACEAILDLEKTHAPRRKWVWARLGSSPMATLIEHLAVVAHHARSPLGASTIDDMASAYAAGPWRADAAAWQALSLATGADAELVRDTLSLLMSSWLDDGARAFQSALARRALPTCRDLEAVEVEPGTCLLFADGLRFDLGRVFDARLQEDGFRVRSATRWAASPTVTATAKPAVTPAVDAITGGRLGEDFEPQWTSNGRPVNAASLREVLVQRGFQIITDDIDDGPTRPESRGFFETGEIDKLGHSLDGELARHLAFEIDRLVDRVRRLFDAGWSSVRVVTDHGWLFLPGGLPRIDLPRHLTASRWARCATIAGDSRVDAPRFPWFWNPGEFFAGGPGICCFNKSPAYAHGGMSLQECLTPDIFVERGGAPSARARIRSVTWRGMRCLVEAEISRDGLRLDLRLRRINGESVAKSPRVFDDSGAASVVVADDKFEGDDLVVVILDLDGSILAERRTKVGADT